MWWIWKRSIVKPWSWPQELRVRRLSLIIDHGLSSLFSCSLRSRSSYHTLRSLRSVPALTVEVETNNFQGNVNNTFIRMMPTKVPVFLRTGTGNHRSASERSRRSRDSEMNGMTIVGSSFPHTGEVVIH